MAGELTACTVTRGYPQSTITDELRAVGIVSDLAPVQGADNVRLRGSVTLNLNQGTGSLTFQWKRCDVNSDGIVGNYGADVGDAWVWDAPSEDPAVGSVIRVCAVDNTGPRASAYALTAISDDDDFALVAIFVDATLFD